MSAQKINTPLAGMKSIRVILFSKLRGIVVARRDNFEFLKILRVLVALKKVRQMLHNLGHAQRAMDLNVHMPLKKRDDN